MKRCSMTLVGEMQIKTTMKLHFTPTCMAIIVVNDNDDDNNNNNNNTE